MISLISWKDASELRRSEVYDMIRPPQSKCRWCDYHVPNPHALGRFSKLEFRLKEEGRHRLAGKYFLCGAHEETN